MRDKRDEIERHTRDRPELSNVKYRHTKEKRSENLVENGKFNIRLFFILWLLIR